MDVLTTALSDIGSDFCLEAEDVLCACGIGNRDVRVLFMWKK